MGDIRHEIGDAGTGFFPELYLHCHMRTILMTVMMLCACLFTPGCTGADEEIICEDTTTLTQYEVFECEFTGTGWTQADIYVQSTESSSESGAKIWMYIFPLEQYDSWANCEDFEMKSPQYYWWGDGEGHVGVGIHGLSVPAREINLENFEWETFYVVFERGPDSCDEEDDSLPVAEFSFKVVVTY